MLSEKAPPLRHPFRESLGFIWEAMMGVARLFGHGRTAPPSGPDEPPVESADTDEVDLSLADPMNRSTPNPSADPKRGNGS